MTQNQTSYELRDRTLWIDGDTSIHSSLLSNMLLRLESIDFSKVRAKEINNDVKKFNQLTEESLTLKGALKPFSEEYTIPDEYQDIDIKTFTFNKLYDETSVNAFSSEEIELRINRIVEECQKVSDLKLTMLFRSMIFLIDFMKEQGTVWGVGRGSSCASYILYLIGVHSVDAVKYNLDCSEFFRT